MHNLPAALSTAYVIDGMALLQGMNERSFVTFDDLWQQVLHCLSRIFDDNIGVEVIAVVFDRYDNPQSIKQLERLCRGDEKGPSYTITSSRAVPNFRQLCANPAANLC